MSGVFRGVFLEARNKWGPSGMYMGLCYQKRMSAAGKRITIGFVFFQRKSTIVSSCDFLMSRSLMQSLLGQRPKRALMRSSHTELNVSTYLSVTSREGTLPAAEGRLFHSV